MGWRQTKKIPSWRVELQGLFNIVWKFDQGVQKEQKYLGLKAKSEDEFRALTPQSVYILLLLCAWASLLS